MSSKVLPVLTLWIDTRCPLCLRSAAFLSGVDEQRRLRFQSIYDEAALGALMGAVPATFHQRVAMHAVDAEGRWFIGPQAVGQALIRMPAPWSWVGRLLLLPPVLWVAQPVYHQIANNRHKWLPPLTPETIAALRQKLPDLTIPPACEC